MSQPAENRRVFSLSGALIVVSALLFCGVVVWHLVTVGPFAWHFSQPSFRHPLIEALILFSLLASGLAMERLPRWLRMALIAVPSMLYLRHHYVDLVAVVVLLYVEGLLALGAVVLRLCGERSRPDDAWLRALIAGVALMSVWLWGWQWVGWGLPREQRLLAFAVLLPLVLMRWRALHSVALVRAAWHLPARASRLWAAVIAASLMLLLAHTNTTFEFDSSWYGLRPDRVLVGERSVFDFLGLTTPVYYFPKLYEVLLLPLHAMRENSVILGMAIAFGGALAHLAYAMLRRLGNDQTLALAGAATILSVPALANATLTAKPDVFTALMVVAMIWFGWNLASDHRRWDLAWVFSCAGLAVSSKLLALSYVGIGGIVCLMAAVIAWRAPRPVSSPAGAAPWVLAACALVGFLVCLRTYLLTGVPTVGPDPLVRLWNLLGMELRLPAGTLVWMSPQDWARLPEIYWGWLASPSLFSHIQITWASNVWLWLGVIALLLPRTRLATAAPRWLLWALPLTGLGMLTFIGFTNRGGDGNYFIVPMVLAIVVTLDVAARRCAAPARRNALFIGLAAFTLFHTAYALASASWSGGIRPFAWELGRSPRDTPKVDRGYLDQAHLLGVQTWLRSQPRPLRIVGDLPHAAGMRLAARYEDFGSIYFSLFDRPEPFTELLACGQIEAGLVPLGEHEPSKSRKVQETMDLFAALPDSRDLYRDAHWRLVDLEGVFAPCRHTTTH